MALKRTECCTLFTKSDFARYPPNILFQNQLSKRRKPYVVCYLRSEYRGLGKFQVGEPITKEEFSRLIDHIVREFLPNEIDAFEIAKDQLVDRVYSGTLPSKLKQQSAQIEFGLTADVVVSSIDLAKATFEFLREIWQALPPREKKSPELTEVDQAVRVWKSRMTASGIDENLADLVARANSADVLKMLYKMKR